MHVSIHVYFHLYVRCRVLRINRVRLLDFNVYLTACEPFSIAKKNETIEKENSLTLQRLS